MSVRMRAWADNPVLTKELRVRMRGARAYWILTGYLVVLSLILFMQYLSWLNSVVASGAGFSASSKIGQQFFAWIMGTQAFLVIFITPALTSGAITIEREQRTMDMLTLTRLSRWGIVGGKLLSAIGFVALLLVSSLPLTSICFFLGGVSPDQVVNTYILLLMSSFVIGALGMAWSTVAKTTASAVLLTYCSLGLVLLALPIVFGSLFSAAGNGLIGAFAMAAFGLYSLFGNTGAFGPSGMGGANWSAQQYFGLTLPVWAPAVVTYLALGLLLTALAVVRIETFPERKAWIPRLLVGVFVLEQVFFVFGAAVAAIGPMGARAGMGPFSLSALLIHPTVLLLLLLPIFTTGEIPRGESALFVRYLAGGWHPKALLQGRPSSGAPYLLLIAALTLVAFALSFGIWGPAATLSGATGAGRAAFALRRAQGLTDFYGIAAALVAAVLGFSAIGLWISAVVKNRWAALCATYAAVFFVIFAPLVSYGQYVSAPDPKSPGLLMNLIYMNPITSMVNTDTPTRVWASAPLAFDGTPTWMATVLMHTFTVALSLFLAYAATRPRAYRQMRLPARPPAAN